MHPLYVAFVWHMHQPYYRDLRTGEIPMPWVRLHAAKDYLHMAEMLARYPAVHLTINMVPSLTEQMLAWAEDTGNAQVDDLWRLAEQETWSTADKRRIINLCFSISWDRVIRSHPRYAQLLDRRPQALADPETFTDQDIRDLVAWFNLVWIDPGWRSRDPELQRLVNQGRGFTLADVRTIPRPSGASPAGVAPLRPPGRRGPARTYHVALFPSHSAPVGRYRRCAPRRPRDLPVPEPPFCAPEDVAAQLQMAVESHTAALRRTARRPVAVGRAYHRKSCRWCAGRITWLASGETILSRSLGRPLDRDGSSLLTDPRTLYQPYRVLAGTELGPYMVFRDQELADRNGFLYQHLPGQQAAEDLIYRLLEIRRRLNDAETPYLVPIILDGENCWEHYEQNGDVFLNALYGALSRRPELRAVTVSEYLALRHQPAATLARLATGSWIGGDLTTWIGDPEHNRAWAVLQQTREHLVARTADIARVPEDVRATAGLQRAWHALYAAEGSDWFWWYSHRNSSQQDTLFDRLYRHDLAAVFEALGDPVLSGSPGRSSRRPQPADHRPAQGYVNTGDRGLSERSLGCWRSSARRPLPAAARCSAGMAVTIDRLFVGHDPRNLYLRFGLRAARSAAYDLAIYLSSSSADGPAGQQIRGHYRYPRSRLRSWPCSGRCAAKGRPRRSCIMQTAAGGGRAGAGGRRAVGDKVLEVSIPNAALGLAQGAEPEPGCACWWSWRKVAMWSHNCRRPQWRRSPLAKF